LEAAAVVIVDESRVVVVGGDNVVSGDGAEDFGVLKYDIARS
jgi:hypothetical protein